MQSERERIAEKLVEYVTAWKWETISGATKLLMLNGADFVITERNKAMEDYRRRVAEGVCGAVIGMGYRFDSSIQTATNRAIFVVPLIAPPSPPKWCRDDCPHPWKPSIDESGWYRFVDGEQEFPYPGTKCCEFCTAPRPETKENA